MMYLEDQKIKAEKENLRIKALEKIYETYDDVKEVSTRWKSYLASTKIIPDCNDFHTVKSCGCCADAVLYVMPFLIIEEITIFSNPCQIPIGHGDMYCCGTGYHMNDTWLEKMKELGFNEKLIQKVQEYVDENSFVYFDEEDDE